MAEKYFVIFNRREQGPKQPEEEGGKTIAHSETKVLPAKTTAPKSTGQLEDALVLYLETPAASVAEAQNAIYALYPGEVTGTPVVVTSAAFKES